MQLKLIKNDKNNSSHAKIKKLNVASIKHGKTDKVRPFLRYPGSKYNASKYIEPFWNSIKFDEYREPFLGSGAIFFKMPKVENSWLNDIDQDLINSFVAVSDKKLRKKLIERIKEVKPTKDLFEKLKAWKPKTNIDKAFRYFVINRTAYSGIMNLPNWGFHPTKSVQPDKWADRLIQAGQKLEGVKITSRSFLEVINEPSDKKVWLFIDPPYFKADQKRAYFHSFTKDDHLKLLEALKKTKHYFCLTYDNCEEIKELYSWANIYEIDWMYHTANSNVTTRKMGRELIISNYEIDQE
jgi:DNA adenine methylase